MPEKPRSEPAALALVAAAAVAGSAHLLPHRPIPIAAVLAVVLSSLFTRAPLRDLGFRRPERPWRLLLFAIALGVGLNAFGRTFIWPVIERIFGPRDLSYLGPIKGNLDVLLGLMPLVWLSAALCEEIIYRGFVQQRLERAFGRGKLGNALAILLASVAFGLNHAVQGTAGMVITGFVATVFGAIFILTRHNLLLLVLAHGIWDTFSLTLRYLDSPW
ncbi:MAG TPA: CPBP family intramembrane glutamic endopeptidase [Chthoniobacterales bacterium]